MLFKNCNGSSKYINIITMELNGCDEFGGCGHGLGTILFSHSLRKQFLHLYCVQSARERTVNKSRPCPYGAYILLRERDNNTVNEANNETVLIVVKEANR